VPRLERTNGEQLMTWPEPNTIIYEATTHTGAKIVARTYAERGCMSVVMSNSQRVIVDSRAEANTARWVRMPSRKIPEHHRSAIWWKCRELLGLPLTD
jgi:hypothetical protein